MEVTRDFLNSGIKEGCIPCYEQCRILGILYPPPKKWKDKVIGKNILDSRAEKYLSLKEKTDINPKQLKKLKRKNYSEQHEYKPKNSYKPFCEPTYTEDGKHVIITKEWLLSGMTAGVGLKHSQAKVLGVDSKKTGWLDGIIGAEITVAVANKYIELKTAIPSVRCKKSQKKQNAKKFINDFLKPESEGVTNRKSVEGKMSTVRYLSASYNKDMIIQYIKKMPYKEFLKTPYWKVIADYQKYNAGYKCVICGSSNVLNVHHTTYKHHGDEVTHIEDLITVCRECHKAIHGIK